MTATNNYAERMKMYLDYKVELKALIGEVVDDIVADNIRNDCHFLLEGQDNVAEWVPVKNGQGKEVGFIVISLLGNLENSNNDYKYDYFIQESYIKPECRRLGLMRKAVENLFKTRPGYWGLYIMDKNLAARAFWDAVIGDRWVKDESLWLDEYGKERAFRVGGDE